MVWVLGLGLFLSLQIFKSDRKHLKKWHTDHNNCLVKKVVKCCDWRQFLSKKFAKFYHCIKNEFFDIFDIKVGCIVCMCFFLQWPQFWKKNSQPVYDVSHRNLVIQSCFGFFSDHLIPSHHNGMVARNLAVTTNHNKLQLVIMSCDSHDCCDLFFNY